MGPVRELSMRAEPRFGVLGMLSKAGFVDATDEQFQQAILTATWERQDGAWYLHVGDCDCGIRVKLVYAGDPSGAPPSRDEEPSWQITLDCMGMSDYSTASGDGRQSLVARRDAMRAIYSFMRSIRSLEQRDRERIRALDTVEV